MMRSPDLELMDPPDGRRSLGTAPGRRAFALLALCLAPLAGGAAPGAAPATVTSQLIDLEHRWVKALESKDARTLEVLLADSFVDSAYNGALYTRQDVLAGIQAPRPYHSIRLEDLTVRAYGGDTAIVNGVNVVQDRTGERTVRVRFTDVFILRQGHWQAVSAQETVQTDR